MPRYPAALWLPLPENSTEPAITATQIILHTAACRCGDSLRDEFDRKGNDLEAHFFVRTTGVVEQYVDTSRQADANYQANVRAISVETQDDGDSTKPWSPAQLDALVALIIWAVRNHPGVKAVVCPAWDKPGIGHHTLFGAPSHWTPVAKSCPGPARKGQFSNIVRWVQLGLGAPTPPATGTLVDDMFIAWSPDHAFLMAGNRKQYLNGPKLAEARLLGLKEIAAPLLVADTPDA